MKIPFNKPYSTGKELENIEKTIDNGKLSGNQYFTKKVQQYFNQNFGFKKSLLTTSCTDALEMSAILCDIESGDEVICPSFTFVSTSNAFILRGARLVFADSYDDNPNIDHTKIESLITEKTKAIVVVHYAGVACDMDPIIELCKKHNLYLIEDAAQGVYSYYKGRPLGIFGDLSTFSFHETKNIVCGEGGMLVVNNSKFIDRSEIIWEKGTNRSAFFRGDIDKYGWVDIGSSFLLSDILAAFLWAQIEISEDIQKKRISIWNTYYDSLSELFQSKKLIGPTIPSYATNNGHMFYIVSKDLEERNKLIALLRSHGIHAVFHYQSLHKSEFYASKHDGRALPNADKFTDCLIRLPFFYELTEEQILFICDKIHSFFK